MKNRTGELREEIAGRIIVDCGYDSEYPCPHNIPVDDCPHEDKDICMWQLEQADEFLKICKEKGLKFVTVSRPGVYPIIEEIEIEEDTD